MRVRILVGHQTGQVLDVCQSEGENMLTTGFAELARPDPVVISSTAAVADVEPTRGDTLADAEEDAVVAPEPEPEPVPARVRRRKKTTTSETPARKRR